MQIHKNTELLNEGLNLESLMEALFYRDEFITLASHELKTPLTAMRLHAKVFQRNSHKYPVESYSKDKVDLLVNQIDVQTSRLIKLVENMLDITRIRSGQLKMTKSHFNLSEMLQKLINNLNHKELNRINLKTDPDILFYGDRDRIEQVFYKLINNASRYSKDLPIAVKLANAKSKISFSVKDEGHGISQEDQKRIFNRFQRAVPASEISGLGLGLYIAREIVEAHNGKISLKSELEQGSTFKVDFKLGDNL
jgi:signal transduction histidine kinase